jgi:nucleoside-diphosphate-sugar epimerase
MFTSIFRWVQNDTIFYVCHGFVVTLVKPRKQLSDMCGISAGGLMQRQKILLTGASGAVGVQALRELLRRQGRYQTRIFSLDMPGERKRLKQYLDSVEVVWGDLRNLGDVMRAVEGVDVVLHVAGIIPPMADLNPKLAWSVNVDGTQNLVSACQQQCRSPKIIFTSSVSVYGDRIENPGIRVGDPLNPSEGDEYARTKIEAENIIRNSGLPFVIFRLCGILVNRLKIQPLMFHMPLRTALEWCHDSDAGFALVQSIDADALKGRIFNLGGGEKCRIVARDFLRRMFPLWGLDAKILPNYAFATRNFHSGYFLDGDELDDMLHFRRNTLQDYLIMMRKQVSPVLRWIISKIPDVILKAWILKLSDPLQAIIQNNEKLVRRYYGSRAVFDSLVQGEAFDGGAS